MSATPESDHSIKLTVSKAIATGRPSGSATEEIVHIRNRWIQSRIICVPATAFLVLSITLWWNSYEPWEKFIRTVVEETEMSKCRYAPENLRLTNVNTSTPQFGDLLYVVYIGACKGTLAMSEWYTFRRWYTDSPMVAMMEVYINYMQV